MLSTQFGTLWNFYEVKEYAVHIIRRRCWIASSEMFIARKNPETKERRKKTRMTSQSKGIMTPNCEYMLALLANSTVC